MPTAHINAGVSRGYSTSLRFPTNISEKAAEDGPRPWIPAMRVRGREKAPDPGWPGNLPRCCSHLKNEPTVGRALCFSLDK